MNKNLKTQRIVEGNALTNFWYTKETPTKALLRTPTYLLAVAAYALICFVLLAFWIQSRMEPGYVTWSMGFGLFIAVTAVVFGGVSLEAMMLTWPQKIALRLVNTQLFERDKLMFEQQAEIAELKSQIKKLADR